MRAVSFKTRLVAGTLSLVLGFVVLAIAALTHLIGQYAEQQIARDLDASRLSHATWLGLKVAALRERAEFLSQWPLLAAAVGTGDATTTADTLEDAVAGRRATVAITDTQGRVLASTFPSIEAGMVLGMRAGMQEALGGAVCDRLWHVRGPALVALSPVLQGDAILGVLVAGEPLDTRAAAAIAEFTGRDVTVLDEAGGVHVAVALDAPGAARHAGSAPGMPAVAERLALAARPAPPPSGRRIDLRVRERRHVAVAVPLHADGGVLVLSRDLREIDALSHAAHLWLWAAGASIGAFGILFSLRTARRLSQPLRELTEATTGMARGDLQVRVDVARADEIGHLGASFNTMAAQIRALVDNVSAQAERAETASRAKDSFLSSMSHELRTPITNIKASAEILQQFGDESAASDRVEFAGMIGHEADRLAYIVGQVLDFTQIQTGGASPRIAAVDLGAVVHAAIEPVGDLARLRGITITTRLSRETAARGDADRLTQMVAALVRNAVQFSAPDSEVGVALRMLGDVWELSVSDRGPGIADDVKERVFESFYQHGDTLTAKPAGAGLGLTIARAIAQAHGGRVWCEDNPGGGARFVVQVPRAGGPAADFASA